MGECAENAEVGVWLSEFGSEKELWLGVQESSFREDRLLDVLL